MAKLPKQYVGIGKRFKTYFDAVNLLGETARKAGPLDDKISHLIQLAAATTIRSEGAVHSHARRALASGARPDEIYHAVLLLTSTIGFPTVSAALSWIDDVIAKRKK